MDDHADAPPSHPVPVPNRADLNAVKIPMLVSGIFNAVTAAGLLIGGLASLLVVVGCFILPFAIPFAILAYFEITTYTQLDKPGDKSHLRPRVQIIAILEICTIVFSNLPSAICGVLTLVNLKALDDPP